MPRKPPLRVAKPGETAPVLMKAKDLQEAVDRSERELLVTMRARLAAVMDAGVPPHTLAPLARQLREIDKEIRLLDVKAAQESDDDDSARPDEAWDSATF